MIMAKGKGLKVRMRAGTLAVVLVLLLAACAQATPGFPTGTSSASEEVTAGPTPSESAAPSPSPSPSEPGATQTTTPAAGLSLSSIRMVSPTAGWATSEDSFHLYRTTDGGTSWQDVTPPEAGGAHTSPGALEGLDEQTAWIGFTRDEQKTLTVFATHDGGKTWQGTVFHQPTARTAGAVALLPYVKSLQFLDVTHGWLLVTYGGAAGSEWVELYRTDDGGASWTHAASGAPDEDAQLAGGDKTGVRFADERNGWLTGSQNTLPGELLGVTHDGGKTWHSVDLPAPAGYATPGADMTTYPPTFFTPQQGVLPVIFGDGSDHPTLLFYGTHDGGAAWQAGTLLPGAQTFHGYRWSVLDSGHLFASDGSRIYLSSDEGQTWQTVEPDAKLAPLAQLDFVSPEVGWALVGDLQVDELLELWKTTDGGRHWSALP
mgnify:CR=1 FL=1